MIDRKETVREVAILAIDSFTKNEELAILLADIIYSLRDGDFESIRKLIESYEEQR